MPIQRRRRHVGRTLYSVRVPDGRSLRFKKNINARVGPTRVVSVLDSGAEGPGFKSQSRRCLSGNSLRQTVHTHRASVHQAAKLVAALLRVAGVTAGLADSNGSLPPGL